MTILDTPSPHFILDTPSRILFHFISLTAKERMADLLGKLEFFVIWIVRYERKNGELKSVFQRVSRERSWTR